MFTLIMPLTAPPAMERGMSAVGKQSTPGLGGGPMPQKDMPKTPTVDRRCEEGNPMTAKPTPL